MSPENKNRTVSLNKYISDTGLCSRREADKIIKSGKVTINGIIAINGNRVSEQDIVLLDGKPLQPAVDKIYIALNKPVGITCTTEHQVRDNIVDFVNHPERIFPVGRLDKYSEGLILLTNDGELSNEMTKFNTKVEKEYIVSVNRKLTSYALDKMAEGVELPDLVTPPCFTEQVGNKAFKVILTKSFNFHIRRMCQTFGIKILRLKRVRLMHIRLGNLRTGRWRDLNDSEIRLLKRVFKKSPEPTDKNSKL